MCHLIFFIPFFALPVFWIFPFNAGEDLMVEAGVTKFNGEIFAPTFTIEDVKGRSVRLEDYLNKVILLNPIDSR